VEKRIPARFGKKLLGIGADERSSPFGTKVFTCAGRSWAIE
jgi:hypothetical protein